MRRIILIILCCMMLVTTASAAGITTAQSNTVVKQDGSCDVTLTMTLQFEQPVQELKFPLPAVARNITVNGSMPGPPRPARCEMWIFPAISAAPVPIPWCFATAFPMR